MEKFDKSLLKFDRAVETVSDEEYAAALAPVSRIKTYERQNLSILAVDFKGVSEKDDRWIAFNIMFGFSEWKASSEEKDGVKKPIFIDENGKKMYTINQYLLVPVHALPIITAKNGPTPYVFRNLQEFVAALGYTILPSNVQEVTEKLFGDPEKLVGAVVDVLPGYDKNHVARNEDGTWSVFNEKGTKLKLKILGTNQEVVNSYEDKDVAEGEAIACGVNIDMKDTYTKIIKFYPAKEPLKLKKKVSFAD